MDAHRSSPWPSNACALPWHRHRDKTILLAPEAAAAAAAAAPPPHNPTQYFQCIYAFQRSSLLWASENVILHVAKLQNDDLKLTVLARPPALLLVKAAPTGVTQPRASLLKEGVRRASLQQRASLLAKAVQTVVSQMCSSLLISRECVNRFCQVIGYR